MPRGQKKCPSCQVFVGSRASSCLECSHIFKKVSKKTPKPFFKERKAFIKRMLGGGKSSSVALDMGIVTEIFDKFKDNIPFITSVKPPFKMSESIVYLKSRAGINYLDKKLLEYNYNPENKEEIIDSGEKVGEDSGVKRKQTLRNFLNDE